MLFQVLSRIKGRSWLVVLCRYVFVGALIEVSIKSRPKAAKCTLNRIKREIGLSLLVFGLCFGQTLIASTATERTADVASSTVSGAPHSVDEKGPEPIDIFVSIRPLGLIVDELIPKQSRDLWRLKVLVPSHSTPHDYQLKPSDLAGLKRADAFFWLGGSAEPQFKRALDSVSTRSVSLADSKVRWREVADEEPEVLHHNHHHHGVLDPHIWLSLKQLPLMLEYYSAELQALVQNTDALGVSWTPAQVRDETKALQAQLAVALKKHQQVLKKSESLASTWIYRDYISFHDAFGYLDQAFNIQSLGSFVQNPEDGISPRQLRRLQSVIETKDLGCIFLEPSADGRQIESLIQGNVPFVDLDILATSLPSGVDLSSFWEYLLEQMQVCFGRAPSQPAAVPPKEIELPLRPVPKEESRIIDKLKLW